MKRRDEEGKEKKEETKLRILEVIASLHLPSLVIKYNFNKHPIMTELCSRDPIFSLLEQGRGFRDIFETNGRENTVFDRKICQKI